MLLTSMLVLALGLIVEYQLSYKSTLVSELTNTQALASEASDDLDHLLIEKVKTALTLGNTPSLKHALRRSNQNYADLPVDRRNERISLENDKWLSIHDPSDNFVLEFTDNTISQGLKNQQSLLQGDYGEIFLTNKYGALVASTAKLSTFAHGHKYWWQGAYDHGKGAAFLDDRGYDESVGGYVLGIVVPIRDGNEVIGILKCNLNILDDLSEFVFGSRDQIHETFTLVRSGGLVVIGAGVEPLSTRISSIVLKSIELNPVGSLIDDASDNKNMIGYSEVGLSQGEGKYLLGGTFESIDHIKGNTGESWYIICSRPMDDVMAPVHDTNKTIIQISIAIILVFFIVSIFYGRTIGKPLNLLTKATIKVRAGDFNSRIELKSNDEFGSLADHFNIMVDKIGHMNQDLTDHSKNLEKRVEERTVALSNSNQKLLNEISERKKIHDKLELSEAKYRSLFENMLDGFALHKIVLDENNKPVDYIFIEVNDAFEKQTGLKRADIIGKSVTEVLPGIETDPSDWIGVYGGIATGGEEQRFEQYAAPLGRWYSVLAYSPKKKYFATLSLDITNKKLTEQELVEADSIKELLLDIITHDLKNPAGNIYSMSHKAMQDDPENKMIGVIHFSSQELLNQLEKASILAQATLGETIPVEKLNLLEILKEVLDEFNSALQNAGIILKMDIPTDITITANPLIAQVFKNYLSNAIRHARSGKEIIIETKREKDGIVVMVNDMGETIPEKDRARIFERSAQLANGKRLGRGLGLAIVKRIAAAHRGEVWVEPNQPKGNKFCLRLPT